MPGCERPELRPDHVHDALARGCACRSSGMPNSSQLRSSACDLLAREVVGDRVERRALARVGRDVVVGGRERAVGPAHLAAGEPQALEGLGRGDLVHEVEVDVDQRRAALLLGRAHLVRLPDLLEHGLGHRQLLLRPAAITDMNCASRRPGFSKWCGRSASNVTASPCSRSCATPSQTSRTPPVEHDRGLAAAGLVHRRVAGAAGGGARGERVQRDLGALARQRAASAPRSGGRRAWPPSSRWSARTTVTPSPSSRRSSCERVSSRPAAIFAATASVGRRVAPLDLGEHRRRHAAALGEVAQREVHRLAQGLDARRRPRCGRWPWCRCHGAYVITYVCITVKG